MRTVVVAGALANKPLNGGEAWVRLSWLLGLKRLDFRTYFVEQIDRQTCVDAAGQVVDFEHSLNLAYFKQVVADFGLTGSAALIYAGGEQVYGATMSDLLALARTADLLINISGQLTWAPMFGRFRRSAYIDIDPGFTQFWHSQGAELHLEDHDYHFTIAENIGTPACTIPMGGIQWRPTRQPVVLDDWPVTQHASTSHFTSIASWRGPFGRVTHAGKSYGLKLHEWRKVLALPERVARRFEIALNIHPAEEQDLLALRRHGWRLVEPRSVAATPSAFRAYVQRSGAEFSVAQGIYVDTASGWFSDRTVRYLASGKPALVQETGFSRGYPVGEGLVAFRDLDEAIAGAEAIWRDYARHCSAARAIATRYFDSDTVLAALVEEIGI